MSYTMAVLAGAYFLSTVYGPTVSLEEYNPCGPNALYFCARMAGFVVRREQVIELCRPDADGACSAADLVRAARAIGFSHAVAVQTTVDELARLRLPAIVHDNQRNPPHFLAVVGQRPEEFLVVNLPGGHYWLNKQKAGREWDGHAVLLSDAPIPGLAAGDENSPGKRAVWIIPVGVGLIAGIFAGVLARNARRRTPAPVSS